MNKIIRYGIVGIGGMGNNHANLFLNNKIENANLSAILDKDVALAKNYPNIAFYSNASKFFNKKIIDVAIIATPHSSHINLGIQALENNININVALAKESSLGVDTEEDFLAIKKIMEYKLK